MTDEQERRQEARQRMRELTVEVHNLWYQIDDYREAVYDFHMDEDYGMSVRYLRRIAALNEQLAEVYRRYADVVLEAIALGIDIDESPADEE